jgi:ATP-dependent Clp protease ATP-binding subunit ClpC
MPKVNVYLPDDLAAAVRDSGVPLSAVCQRALEQAVRDVRAARENKGLISMATLERFTNRARTVMRLSKEYARQAGREVSAEDLLLALIVEGEGVAAKALTSLGLTVEVVAAACDGRAGQGDGDLISGLALREALKLGHNYIGTEHLLLGLIASATASDLIAKLGLTASGVRSEVITILTGMGIPAPAPPPAEPASPDVVAKLDEILRRLDDLERRYSA